MHDENDDTNFEAETHAESASGGQQITPFLFEGEHLVRTLDIGGAPWFVLVDVCRVLSIRNPSQAASRLDADEKDTLHNAEGIADPRAQSLTIINESGLYSLILTSRKPSAKRFKKWVTAEVLPTIRKTGRYEIGGAADAVADAGGSLIAGKPIEQWTVSDWRVRTAGLNAYASVYGQQRAQWFGNRHLGFPVPPNPQADLFVVDGGKGGDA
ncbi:MAG: hypothetical protein LDL44_00630 [Caenispirillum sp.]|nr:hypothetical protein [Caenispirillum sp.]